MQITAQIAFANTSYRHVVLEVADARPKTIKAALDARFADDNGIYDHMENDLDSPSETYVVGIVDGEWPDIYTGGADLAVPAEYSQVKAMRDWVLGDTGKQPEALESVLLDILAYEKPDEEGDIVEAFSEFQNRIKAAMFTVDPVTAAGASEVIGRLTEALEEALDQHIYDESNGDEPEPDCAYVSAVQAGKAWLDAASPPAPFKHDELELIASMVRRGKDATIYDEEHQELESLAVRVLDVRAFAPPPVGALAVISALAGAVGELDHNIGQMEGLFDDDDGTIAQARADGDEALALAQAYRAALPAEPITFIVNVSGGVVQDVEVNQSVAGARCIVVDYDVEHGDAETEVDMGDGKWVPAVVSTYESEATPVSPAPISRPVETMEAAS